MSDAERAEQDAAACHYMDEGWEIWGDRRGWKPSELFKIGYAIISTSGTANALRRAEIWRAETINRAIERWHAGFFANPFSEDPISRPVMQEAPNGRA